MLHLFLTFIAFYSMIASVFGDGNMFDEEELKYLKQYYKDTTLAMIGLNDSQGINCNVDFFKDSFFGILVSALKDYGVAVTDIDAFSGLFNKTEHIDYLLDSNLTYEEIKELNICGMIKSLEKIATDLSLPKFIAKLANIYKFAIKTNENDKEIKITDILKTSKEPIIIYSTGSNNLMREVGNNPAAIVKDYKNRDKKPNYNYTLDKMSDPKVFQGVMDGVENNFKKILDINNTADIYALGLYTPHSFHKEGLDDFINLKNQYNDSLMDICSKYHMTYIDMNAFGDYFSKGDFNFHISSKAHNYLASYVLSIIYNRKFNHPITEEKKEPSSPLVNGGVSYYMSCIRKDIENTEGKANKLLGYERKREFDVAEEHKRELEALEEMKGKVLTKRIKGY